jgi:hypothetical protein
MSLEKYEVMSEFFKLAEEQDLLGLKKTAAPEKNPHQEDLKTIEEKRLKSPEKSIIEEAHPEPAYVAEARGDGGLVENQLEQQKKLVEMLNKMPTGSLVGRYASAGLELIKIANICDELGNDNAADALTDAAHILFSKAIMDPDMGGGWVLGQCETCGKSQDECDCSEHPDDACPECGEFRCPGAYGEGECSTDPDEKDKRKGKDKTPPLTEAPKDE